MVYGYIILKYDSALQLYKPANEDFFDKSSWFFSQTAATQAVTMIQNKFPQNRYKLAAVKANP